MDEIASHSRSLLKKYWGYSSFRPLQEDIIRGVINKKDQIALLPTGGGKSICYQIPALMMEGCCLVVSPLVALIQDQFDGLKSKGISAAMLHGGMDSESIETILDNAKLGVYKFLFLAPERLSSQRFREHLQHIPLSYIAVDEAHCISAWGKDFRPSYRKIHELRDLFPESTFLALTATATEAVIQDIQKDLKLKDPWLHRGSMARKNLAYVVRSCEDKREKLLEILGKVKGSCIIYAGRRKACEAMAEWLNSKGYTSKAYHAGLSANQRSNIQSDWIKDRFRVVVATSAFGMGIDKPNVRLVIHWEMPQNLSAYIQEAGRAGRDGINSFAILLHHKKDELRLKKQLPEPIDENLIKKAYQWFCDRFMWAPGEGLDQQKPFQLPALAKYLEMSIQACLNLIQFGQNLGWWEYSDQGVLQSSLTFIPKHRHQLQHQSGKMGECIQFILRRYPGVFEQSLSIDEAYIARSLGWSIAEVQRCLNYLQQYNWAEYRASHGAQWIHWLHPRRDAKTLRINKGDLKRWNEMKLKGYQEMIDYLKGTHCRSVFLQQHFGDTETKACGVCDRCKEGSDRLDLHQQVVQVLRSGPCTFTKLTQHLPQYGHEHLLEAIRTLEEESIIQENKEGYVLKSS